MKGDEEEERMVKGNVCTGSSLLHLQEEFGDPGSGLGVGP